MGIFIHMDISKSVTKTEWEAVYEETLQLIKHFPLADRKEVEIHGVDTVCLVKTEEQDSPSIRRTSEKNVGWTAEGDLETLKLAEEYFLPRDLMEHNNVEADAGDAILSRCPAYLNYDWRDKKFRQVYGIWGGKTQGEPYHMYLLSVACLIEARLGRKAFVYGDITRGQCRRAVEMANEFLDSKIEMPDRCYTDRFVRRVDALDLPENEKLELFEELYLGTKDADFGNALRQYFSTELLTAYWEDKFKHLTIGTSGFNNEVSEYLHCGFELDQLCGLVNFKDDDGNMLYEEFITRIMDAKLHIQEKNCNDVLKIDQEDEQPYSVWYLLGQFRFAGAENKKVDRYIPIDEIRAALKRGLEDKCYVDAVIDAYLKNEAEQAKLDLTGDDVTEEQVGKAAEQDAAETLRQLIDRKRKQLIEDYETYNINDREELMGYEKGDTINPVLAKSLGKLRKALDGILADEPEFAELSNVSVKEQFEWLVLQNRYILIKREDWEQIYKNLEEKPDAFSRYYPLMRLDCSSMKKQLVVRAVMVNDELYGYTRELADHMEESENI